MTRLEVAQKLKQVRAAAGVSQRVAAEAIGRSQQTLGSWETGVSQPDIDTLMRLLRYYNASADSAFELWGQSQVSTEENQLLHKLRMLDDFGRCAVEAVLDVEHRRCAESIRRKTRVLPFPLQSASAGHGNFIDDDLAEFLTVLVNDATLRADYVLRVSGDSMEPMFKQDDIVLVQRTNAVENGEVGVFLVDGDLLVKKFLDNGLVSLNTRYAVLPCTEYCVCRGRVLGKLDSDWIVAPDGRLP